MSLYLLILLLSQKKKRLVNGEKIHPVDTFSYYVVYDLNFERQFCFIQVHYAIWLMDETTYNVTSC